MLFGVLKGAGIMRLTDWIQHQFAEVDLQDARSLIAHKGYSLSFFFFSQKTLQRL